MIPTNAKSIVKARMQGFKPAEMIMVSLVGKISHPNHTVLADPKLTYDWRWLRDLDVCVFITPECNWRDTTLAICRAMPRYMWLWDTVSQRGANVYLKPSHPASEEKPVSEWVWILNFASWFDCQNEGFLKCN